MEANDKTAKQPEPLAGLASRRCVDLTVQIFDVIAFSSQ